MNAVMMFDYPLEVRGYHTCLEDEECEACFLEVKNEWDKLIEVKALEQEGLIYLFREWLDLVSPADFGNDEGLEGVLV